MSRSSDDSKILQRLVRIETLVMNIREIMHGQKSYGDRLTRLETRLKKESSSFDKETLIKYLITLVIGLFGVWAGGH